MNIEVHKPPVKAMRCDLCFFGDPTWRHPSQATLIRDPNGCLYLVAHEGILACNPCNDDVAAPDVDQAAERILARCYDGLAFHANVHPPTLEPFLRRLHATLLGAITGEPTPFKATDDPSKD